MNFKLVNLINFLLLLTYQHVQSGTNAWLEDSVFFKIRKDLGQFKSEIEIIEEGKVNHTFVDERFNYKLNIGEYIEDTDEPSHVRILYSNDPAEFYKIEIPGDLRCTPDALDQDNYDFLVAKYVYGYVFDEDHKYPILGRI